jgi:hypothetical protein
MFERFTEKAIKVIMLAQEEARRLGHNFVGTEQILLGLIGEGTGMKLVWRWRRSSGEGVGLWLLKSLSPLGPSVFWSSLWRRLGSLVWYQAQLFCICACFPGGSSDHA